MKKLEKLPNSPFAPLLLFRFNFFFKRRKTFNGKYSVKSVFSVVLVAILVISLSALPAYGWGKKKQTKAKSEKDAKKYLAIAQKSFTKAQSLREKGKNDLAIAEYKRALEADPSMIEAYLELGDLYIQLEIPEKAVEILEPGLKWAESQSFDQELMGKAYCQLARCHQQVGKLDLASGDLTKAAVFLPEDPLPHQIQGDIFRAQEKTEDALKSYRTGIKRNPKHPDCWLALGNAGIEFKLPDVVQEAYKGLQEADSQKAAEFAQIMKEAKLSPASSPVEEKKPPMKEAAKASSTADVPAAKTGKGEGGPGGEVGSGKANEPSPAVKEAKIPEVKKETLSTGKPPDGKEPPKSGPIDDSVQIDLKGDAPMPSKDEGSGESPESEPRNTEGEMTSVPSENPEESSGSTEPGSSSQDTGSGEIGSGSSTEGSGSGKEKPAKNPEVAAPKPAAAVTGAPASGPASPAAADDPYAVDTP